MLPIKIDSYLFFIIILTEVVNKRIGFSACESNSNILFFILVFLKVISK